MKRLITKTVVLSLPFILMIVLVNFFGDAARLFSDEYEKKIARLINKGSFVTNVKNFDEGLLQKELIINGSIHPEVLIIGSSRTMLISSDLFKGVQSLNNSVSRANIKDVISIYQLYKENHKLPKKIIIGIDPNTFNEYNTKTIWKSLEYGYNRFHKKKAPKFNELDKYKELYSLSYFQKSIESLLSENRDPFPTNKKSNITNTILNDGSLVYGKLYREATRDEIDRRMALRIDNDLNDLESFDVISERIWLDFTKLISDLKQNNIEVSFFIAPVHPKVYEKIEKEYRMVIKTEFFLTEYAKKNNIEIYGTFNPLKLGFNETNFYDGFHCNKKTIERIISERIKNMRY